MTSVAAQVDTAVAADRALYRLPYVVDGAEATASVRGRSRLTSGWLAPGADLLAAAATVLALHLVAWPAYSAATAILPVLWVVVLAGSGAYGLTGLLTSAPLGPVLRAGSTLGFLVLGVAALVDLGTPPATLLVLSITLTVTSVGWRLATDRLTARRACGPAGCRVVVAGTYEQVRQMLDEVRRDPRPGLEVVSVCLPDRAGQDLFDSPVVVGLESLAAAVDSTCANAVVVLPSEHVNAADLRRLGWQLEARGTSFFIGSGLLDVAPARTGVSRIGGVHLMQVRPSQRQGPYRAAKELWERLSAALVMLLLSPVLLCVALLVRLDSPGPAIFRQRRVGRDGHVFTMLKFRTMTTDAETLAAGLLDGNDCDGVLFKMRRDPRITRVGRVLRRYSLDELPQLLNVAGGQMALVGPRPALPAEVDRYDHDPRRRLAVKPGLTGLWQVSGRSDLSWEESVRLDLLYVDNWSLALDLSIVARTAGAVLRARGAY